MTRTGALLMTVIRLTSMASITAPGHTGKAKGPKKPKAASVPSKKLSQAAAESTDELDLFENLDLTTAPEADMAKPTTPPTPAQTNDTAKPTRRPLRATPTNERRWELGNPSEWRETLRELPAIPKLNGSRGAIRDLGLGEFSESSARVAVNGRIHSSLREVADFVVVLEWLDDAGEIHGRGVVILADVEPGEKRWFTIATRVDGIADGSVRCVPQAYSGVLGSSAGAA